MAPTWAGPGLLIVSVMKATLIFQSIYDLFLKGKLHSGTEN